MTSADRPRQIRELVTDPYQPELAQAAGLLLALLRATKMPDLCALARAVEKRQPDVITALAGLRIAPDALALLRTHARALAHLRATPALTLAVCDNCGLHLYITTGNPPSTCSLTAECPGRPVKASVARKYPVID